MSGRTSLEKVEIPQIDLGDLRTIEDFQQAAVDKSKYLGEAVVHAFNTVGFAFVRIPTDLNEHLDAMYDEWTKVHVDMPEEAKQRWWGGDHKFQRGWTNADSELALYCKNSLVALGDGSTERRPVFNKAENWFFGPEGLDSTGRAADDINFLPNVWPDPADLPSLAITPRGETLLKQATTTVHQALLTLDEATMATTEPVLGLEQGYFAYRNDPEHSPSLLRELYYQPVHQEDFEHGLVKGACQHTDICDRTWLPRSRTNGPGKGLEVRTRWGEWISGRAPDGYAVFQVGDMLQHTTGDYFISAQHRVEPPFIEAGNVLGRLSCALFIHPRPETDLGVQIDPGVDGFTPKHYASISAADKLQKRLDSIFD